MNMVETSIIKYCSCSWPRDHEEVGTASFDHMKQGASPNEECLVQNKHHLLKKVKNKYITPLHEICPFYYMCG
jgi:hypothetical protein